MTTYEILSETGREMRASTLEIAIEKADWLAATWGEQVAVWDNATGRSVYVTLPAR